MNLLPEKLRNKTAYKPNEGQYAIRLDANEAPEDLPRELKQAFLQELQAMSEYDTGVDLPAGARALTLSTCWSPYVGGLERYVIHAYRVE